MSAPRAIQFCWCPPMDDSLDPEQHQVACIYREWLHIWNEQKSYPSPFRVRVVPALAQLSPGCYEASFGRVHVKPACTCERRRA